MFSAIKRFFKSAIRKLWKIIKKVVSSALEMFLAELIDYAKEVVKTLIKADLSNEEKRKKAFKEIQVEAMRRGMDYRESWINILIELAVAAIKVEF